jgi:hypothetical protein
MARVIHAQLTQAREVSAFAMEGSIVQADVTRLVGTETTATSRAHQQASLFAETRGRRCPLLLEALARVTRRTPDDLVEACPEEPAQEEGQTGRQRQARQPP